MIIRCGFAWLALFLTIIPGALQVQAEDGGLSEREKLWGLMQVWAEAKFNFPFFDQVPDLDWDASVQEYIPRVIAAKDTETYFDVLMEFAAQLKDGHTAVIPPWRLVRPGWDHPPVEVQVIGDRFFVARVGVSDVAFRVGHAKEHVQMNAVAPAPTV